MIRKSISITDEQAEWIKTNHINLSRFVQSKLDEAIEQLASYTSISKQQE